jgi:hypothetical protein
VHHLEHGGDCWGIEYAALKNRVEKKLTSVAVGEWSALAVLPPYCWEDWSAWTSEQICAGKVDVEPWERAPLRALAQIDDMAKDLSKCFKRVEKEVECYIELDSQISVDCDFLWFNSPRVCRGLRDLAKTFAGEVAKMRTRGVEARGRLMWIIQEFEGDFRCSVRQEVSGGLFPLPDPDKALKKVSEAYERLVGAGASLAVQQGVLDIRIRKTEHFVA